MSVHVTTTLIARPEHTDQVIAKLTAALPESLQHKGCEAIHLRQDQDDPNHIVSFTQWASARTTRTTSHGAPRPDSGTTWSSS